MKIVFLGVGEAFDENYPNNSSLVLTDKTKLLLDCGFTVPSQVWKFNPDPSLLDAIYISHRHGDHFLGLPALFLRMWEGGRKRDLEVICQKDKVKDVVAAIKATHPYEQVPLEISQLLSEEELG